MNEVDLPPDASYEQVQKVTLKYQIGHIDHNNKYRYIGPSCVVTPSGNIEELPSVKFIKLVIRAA